ncbi:hypothetical protein R1flu_025043 [Riccia fluitans]|uniref:Uncharacterized protein n=1 Tax=Riccia fluitans TaxID=41844 RepID=A0ABD1XZM2_9MARC
MEVEKLKHSADKMQVEEILDPEEEDHPKGGEGRLIPEVPKTSPTKVRFAGEEGPSSIDKEPKSLFKIVRRHKKMQARSILVTFKVNRVSASKDEMLKERLKLTIGPPLACLPFSTHKGLTTKPLQEEKAKME